MQAGVGFDDLRVIHSSMKCIRFDVCKVSGCVALGGDGVSSMKCIRFDVCKCCFGVTTGVVGMSSMKCIRFDVCKSSDVRASQISSAPQ